MVQITDITFHINDVEVGDEYNFTGHFFNEAEVDKFIEDNEKVGNDLLILDVHILSAEEVHDLIMGHEYMAEAVRN